ncbi:electron transport complex subunit E [bacterium]|nr:electron transport complex subunit E [candidate division CSSED10-310 bacterium]
MSTKNSIGTVLTEGLWRSNPVLILLLGMCPTLGVTSSAINGIGMGLATTFVLIMSNLVVSAMRGIIPKKMRIPCFIVIIASFVTIVEMLTQAFTPALYKALGVFIPLIVVNCIVLGRSEAFAYKNSVFRSLLDGIGMGIGFTLALGIMGTIREILGNGSILGNPLFGEHFSPMLIMIMPPGAFLTLGYLLGLANYINRMRARKGA